MSSGWITWLKNWFYDKQETDEILSTDSGWQNCTYINSTYTNYGTDNHGVTYPPLQVRRIGKMVELRGYWKPTSQKTSSSTPVQFATLPDSSFHPSQYQIGVMQGTGISKWALRVATDGKLYWERYGTVNYIDMPNGAWCCTHLTWMVE